MWNKEHIYEDLSVRVTRLGHHVDTVYKTTTEELNILCQDWLERHPCVYRGTRTIEGGYFYKGTIQNVCAYPDNAATTESFKTINPIIDCSKCRVRKGEIKDER